MPAFPKVSGSNLEGRKFNVPGDFEGERNLAFVPFQRWHLDLAPVVVSSGEWRWLEKALVQRARLFDAVLGDLYGEQLLLREAVVPAELVFSDPAYLMAARQILPASGGLRFYAADLARGTDGRWRVIDSHTETLAGIGFALANRVAHTHVAVPVSGLLRWHVVRAMVCVMHYCLSMRHTGSSCCR